MLPADAADRRRRVDRLRRWRTSKRTPTLLVSSPIAPTPRLIAGTVRRTWSTSKIVQRLGVNQSAADDRVGPKAAAGHAWRQRQHHAAGQVVDVAAGLDQRLDRPPPLRCRRSRRCCRTRLRSRSCRSSIFSAATPSTSFFLPAASSRSTIEVEPPNFMPANGMTKKSARAVRGNATSSTLRRRTHRVGGRFMRSTRVYRCRSRRRLR